MPIIPVRSTFVLTLTIAAAIALPDSSYLAALGQQPPQPAGVPAPPVIPTRRPLDASLHVPTPDLPSAADRVPALTVEITIQRETRGAIHTQRQTVSRTADRVHLSPSKSREWLFQQNSRDPRRVTGYLIDHPSRTTVMHGESDLRMLMGIRGWSDVLLLGFDIDTLRRYVPSGESRTIAGLRFTRYGSAADTGPPRDLWWSEDCLLAQEFTTFDPDGSTRSSISGVRSGVDSALLRAPESRFPTYRVVNVADWLEHR